MRYKVIFKLIQNWKNGDLSQSVWKIWNLCFRQKAWLWTLICVFFCMKSLIQLSIILWKLTPLCNNGRFIYTYKGIFSTNTHYSNQYGLFILFIFHSCQFFLVRLWVEKKIELEKFCLGTIFFTMICIVWMLYLLREVKNQTSFVKMR